MYGDKQKRSIERFLNGTGKKNVDTFCIYQWIERCHYEGWWDLGCTLGAHVPPNSLAQDYPRRLEFLLRECRSKLNEQFIEVKKPGSQKSHLVPKEFYDLCETLNISFGGKAEQRLRLTYLGKKLGLLEKIDAGGCIFHFYNMDAAELVDWLRQHGFEHLIHQNKKIQELPRKRDKRVLIKVPWKEIPELIKIIYEAEKDNALRGAVIDSLIKTGASDWKKCLGYLAVNHGLDTGDPAIESIRQSLIKAFAEKGHEELAKKISAD